MPEFPEDLWVAFWAGFKQALHDAFYIGVWFFSLAVFTAAFYLWSHS